MNKLTNKLLERSRAVAALQKEYKLKKLITTEEKMHLFEEIYLQFLMN